MSILLAVQGHAQDISQFVVAAVRAMARLNHAGHGHVGRGEVLGEDLPQGGADIFCHSLGGGCTFPWRDHLNGHVGRPPGQLGKGSCGRQAGNNNALRGERRFGILRVDRIVIGHAVWQLGLQVGCDNLLNFMPQTVGLRGGASRSCGRSCDAVAGHCGYADRVGLNIWGRVALQLN